MGINYSELWPALGSLVKWSNAFISYQGNQLMGNSGELTDVQTVFESYNLNLIPSFTTQVSGQANAMAGWISALTNIFNTVLASLQSQLNAPNNNSQTILPLLYASMVSSTETMLATTISAPSITVGSNTGNGVLLLSINNNLGQVDQRIINETVQLVCTNDQFSGTAAGSERFSITGFPTQQPTSYLPQGNGNGPNLTVADSNNLINNGNFESWTNTNTPNNWVTTGTVGTNILQSTTAHSGSFALEFAGDGTTTNINVSQNVFSRLNTTTIYGMSVWLRKAGTVSGGSNLAVNLTGTGFSTINLFNADPATLTTSYQQFHIYFPTGIEFGNNMAVEANWTSANSAGGSAVILIDDFVLNTANSFGNVQYSIYRGSTDFLKGDNFSVVTAVNSPAIWSSYFARFYNFQMPTVASSPSVAESLAE